MKIMKFIRDNVNIIIVVIAGLSMTVTTTLANMFYW